MEQLGTGNGVQMIPAVEEQIAAATSGPMPQAQAKVARSQRELSFKSSPSSDCEGLSEWRPQSKRIKKGKSQRKSCRQERIESDSSGSSGESASDSGRKKNVIGDYWIVGAKVTAISKWGQKRREKAE